MADPDPFPIAVNRECRQPAAIPRGHRMGQSGSRHQTLAHQHGPSEVALPQHQKGRQAGAAQGRRHHVHASHRGGPQNCEIHRHQSQGQHRDTFVTRQNLQHPVPRPQRHQAPEDRQITRVHQPETDRAEPRRFHQRKQWHHPVSVLVYACQIVGAKRRRRVQHRCAEVPLRDQIERGVGKPPLVGPRQVRVRAQHSDRDEHQHNGDDDFHAK